jgi:signal transduction histidine kinase
VTATADLTLADVARLEDIVDRGALAEVCRSFFELFALPIRVLSRDGTLLADVHEAREICRYVNTLERGRVACSALVAEVKDIDPQDGTVVHPCFTGAVYRVVPIDYQGRRLGRFVIGPYLPAETHEVPRTLLRLDPSVDQESARRALGEMPRVRKETAERLAAHLGRVLDLIVFSGHRAFLTSEMHIASVRESFRELTQKTEALQEAYDRLKELDRLKSNFLATVSHELRTPLTSIIGYSDMLATGLAGELNPDQAEFVETIRTKGDHLLALITSLLDLNKLEQGKVAIRREELDTAALVHDVAKTLAPTAAKKNVHLDVELEGELPAMQADPVRVRQVLFNLAENAVKFSPRDSRVVLSARAVDVTPEDDDVFGLVLLATPRRAIEVSVRDAGPGIATQEHERIFDAFYQVDGSSTREHGGTGLGLSIVKRLVEAHGGTVWVESEPGHGACFRFTIPEPEDA